jgi:hypothetical protein
MRQLGDSLARLIEDRTALATTRDDRGALKAARDELKTWLETRDTRMHDLQPLVDELFIRSQALRGAGIAQARRLSEAAALTENHTADDASVLAALRALLLRARQDVAAPLHP